VIPPLFWWALWARDRGNAALVAAQGVGAWLASLSVEARETARAWLLERAVVREAHPPCEVCSALAPRAPGCGYCGQPGMTREPLCGDVGIARGPEDAAVEPDAADLDAEERATFEGLKGAHVRRDAPVLHFAGWTASGDMLVNACGMHSGPFATDRSVFDRAALARCPACVAALGRPS
jgi:hypothetical protein